MGHLLSTISLNIKYGTNIDDIVSSVTINASNQSTININSGTVNTSSSVTNVTMALLGKATEGYEKTYSCILPAQTLNGKAITFHFTDGTSKTMELSWTLSKNSRLTINTSIIGSKEISITGVNITPWVSVSIANGQVNKIIPSYKTGDVITYLKNRETNPVTIVVIPEGFTASQLTYNGLFEQKARAAMDFLFNVEPYKTYKKYFNVYFIAAISNEQGADSIATTGYPAHLHDTYFDAEWEWDGHYSMKANSTTIFNFVTQYCPDIVKGNTDINKVAVFMIINDARYGGMTWTWSTGKSYAMCPLTKGNLTWSGKQPSVTGYSRGDWRNTLVHEGGGHCFGKLGDEYYGTSTYTGKTISSQSWLVPMGLNLTADTTSTSTTFRWKYMIGTGTGKFPKEGLYEGGGGSYSKGIWRPEIISCMIDNRKYYNAWSRYLIANRIVAMAGETLSYEQFLAKDVNYDEILDGSGSSTSIFTRANNEKIYPPLPSPVLIE